jgi:hypothetical protein
MEQINGLYNLGVGKRTDDQKTKKTEAKPKDKETKKTDQRIG